MPERDLFPPHGAAAAGADAADRHPDWPWPPSAKDAALEAELAHLLERIRAECSEIRRHGMWHLYAVKVRMRSDAQIRRMAIEQMEGDRH